MTKKALIISTIMIMSSWGLNSGAATAANADRITFQESAHVVANTPQNCFNVDTSTYSLEGRLSGVIYPADLAENPFIPAQGSLYLTLNKAIATCRYALSDSPTDKMPSYVNVKRVGLGRWPVPLYRAILKKWRGDNVWVAGTLGNVGLGGVGNPGPINLYNIRKICFGKENKKTKHCLPYKTWLNSFPKGQKYEWCDEVACEKARAKKEGLANTGETLLKGGAIVSKIGDQSVYRVQTIRLKECLSYWPSTASVKGHLGGLLMLGGGLGSSTNGLVRMSLVLDHPASICGDVGLNLPGYANVSEIGMGLWRASMAKSIIADFGKSNVTLIGGLGNQQWLPGDGQVDTIIFTEYKKICFRKKFPKMSVDRDISCLPWQTWLSKLKTANSAK